MVLLLSHCTMYRFNAVYKKAVYYVCERYLFLILLQQAIGPSMYPLVEGSGDLLVFERLSGWVFALPNHLPWLNRVWWAALTRRIQLRRGDVVIALSTDQHPVKICKRIVAMVR